VLKLQILGPKAFRVRFNPRGDYSTDASSTVVNRNLGAVQPKVQNNKDGLVVDLGDTRIEIPFASFAVRVFQDGQLISSDTDQGLVYLPGQHPGQEAIADFKRFPSEAYCFGFGEKGGATLTKPAPP